MLLEFKVKSNTHEEMINIDHLVEKTIDESGVKDGYCIVYTPHTTSAITINENADPAVVHDIIAMTNRIFPWNDKLYKHMEGNSAAHIKSSLFGASETVLITNGKLYFGTWQSLFFCEFDGPRTRKVLVKVIQG